MTGPGLWPFRSGVDPPPHAAPVSIVLTPGEKPDIRRYLASAARAEQVEVMYSGSADDNL